jgi:ADP-ribose pyrophosphatase
LVPSPYTTTRARRSRHDAAVSDARVGGQRVYSGRVINVDVDQVRFPDGSIGELEIVRHPGASAVVPFLSDPRGHDPTVLLLEQYRYAADGYLYEIPAGRLEPNEAPLACARRELKEETGCSAEAIEPLLTLYTTPGFTDELIHFFLATGITRGEAKLEADEFARVITLPLSRVLSMISGGEIRDAKTVVALLYAAGFCAGL